MARPFSFCIHFLILSKTLQALFSPPLMGAKEKKETWQFCLSKAYSSTRLTTTQETLVLSWRVGEGHQSNFCHVSSPAKRYPEEFIPRPWECFWQLKNHSFSELPPLPPKESQGSQMSQKQELNCGSRKDSAHLAACAIYILTTQAVIRSLQGSF